ncbi:MULTISPECIES: DUF4385 family protein [Rickettsia]|uniref:Cytoplasmic protein n=1 Tax=Rickettsia tamurae subsp. buchneri TaxID=1462938 RepID=A0A8E1C0M4_9RICK|nr:MULTISPECIES: DUF4385 family protein [Rickettsia]EER21818.1 hypothetical protein REIS_0995 [Rickettsia endosymbiont of Ixodes scapularis]KDO03666.1 hypothetical protein REISMN_00440 [Rickettsia tamurae subsp. buchneri]KJW02576.1 hypothetical protein REIP_0587 [Rickettsia endosymbiont of Ixodes pacificus]
MEKPSYLNFDNKNYKWKNDIDYRKCLESYRVGKGEQGVLICQPYKNEILPYWKFKTPKIAKESSEKIYEIFLKYLEDNDFVGADMARKYLQMGFTKSRRYANYKDGEKYDKENDYKKLERGGGSKKSEKCLYIFQKMVRGRR